jgi:hypothetical protein
LANRRHGIRPHALGRTRRHHRRSTDLKQPLEPIGPLTLIHDHGRTTVEAETSIEELITRTRRAGLTVADAARQLYRGAEDRNAVERARRKLEKLMSTSSPSDHPGSTAVENELSPPSSASASAPAEVTRLRLSPGA